MVCESKSKFEVKFVAISFISILFSAVSETMICISFLAWFMEQILVSNL